MLISNKSIVVYVVGITLFVLLGFGVSYAFFGVDANGNNTASNNSFSTKNYMAVLNDVTSVVITDTNSSAYYKKIITVSNSTANDLTYNLVWQNVINGLYNQDNLTYEAICRSYTDYTNKTLAGTDCDDIRLMKAPTSTTYQSIKNSISLASGITHEYTIYFYYNNNPYINSFSGIITTTSSETTSSESTDYASGTIARMITKNADWTSIISAKGNPTFTSSATTNEGLYSMSDPNGTSYYYRGSVTNNYVTFAGLTWRIVRINGDGTIRLLLNDYAKDTNSNYYSVAYNSSSSCNAPTTITQAVDCAKYGTGTYSSTSIKTTVDTWYSNNITGTNDSYVATGKYCNDYSYTGDGSGFTIFSGWQRIANLKAPSLSCTAASGYTGGGTNVVQAKAGLISADELAIAGGLWETANTNVYYYIDNNDWITLTSDVWYGVSSGMTMLRYYNDINNVFNTYAKRFKPVINLNSSTIVYGLGTATNPYQVII